MKKLKLNKTFTNFAVFTFDNQNPNDRVNMCSHYNGDILVFRSIDPISRTPDEMQTYYGIYLEIKT